MYTLSGCWPGTVDDHWRTLHLAWPFVDVSSCHSTCHITSHIVTHHIIIHVVVTRHITSHILVTHHILVTCCSDVSHYKWHVVKLHTDDCSHQCGQHEAGQWQALWWTYRDLLMYLLWPSHTWLVQHTTSPHCIKLLTKNMMVDVNYATVFQTKLTRNLFSISTWHCMLYWHTWLTHIMSYMTDTHHVLHDWHTSCHTWLTHIMPYMTDSHHVRHDWHTSSCGLEIYSVLLRQFFHWTATQQFSYLLM